jgi:hypothetical protein
MALHRSAYLIADPFRSLVAVLSLLGGLEFVKRRQHLERGGS